MVDIVFNFGCVPCAGVDKYQVVSPYRYRSCFSDPRSVLPVRFELGAQVKMGSAEFTLPSTAALMASLSTCFMLSEFFLAYSSSILCSASVNVVCTTFMGHAPLRMNNKACPNLSFAKYRGPATFCTSEHRLF